MTLGSPVSARRGLRSLLLVLSCLTACSSTPTRSSKDNPLRGERVVPLHTVDFAGHRYVASADLGSGHDVPLMIHGNAKLFLMLTHGIAEEVQGGPVKKTAEYGYSSKGKGAIDLPSMRLGGKRYHDLRDVVVFDFTEEPDAPVQGMVGVAFLTAERAAVDFSRDALILGVPATPEPSPALVARRYKHVPLTLDGNNRVTLAVYFPAIRSELRITPSTVANALTLHLPLFTGKIPIEADTASKDLSPNRTTPSISTSDSVAFEIAGVPLASPATFENFAEYEAVPESALTSVGMLGYDWMKEHQAIVDYANLRLYFKP